MNVRPTGTAANTTRGSTTATAPARAGSSSKARKIEGFAGAALLIGGLAAGGSLVQRRNAQLPVTVLMPHVYPAPGYAANRTVPSNDIPIVLVFGEDDPSRAAIVFNNRTTVATSSNAADTDFFADDPYAGTLHVTGSFPQTLTYDKDGTQVKEGKVYPTFDANGTATYADDDKVHPNGTVETASDIIVPIDSDYPYPEGKRMPKKPQSTSGYTAGFGALFGAAGVGALVVADATVGKGRVAASLRGNAAPAAPEAVPLQDLRPAASAV